MTEDEALRLFTIAHPRSFWTLVDQRRPVSLHGALQRFDEYQAANPDAVVTLVRRVPAQVKVRLFEPTGLYAGTRSSDTNRRLFQRWVKLEREAQAAGLVFGVPAFTPLGRSTHDQLLATIAVIGRQRP